MKTTVKFTACLLSGLFLGTGLLLGRHGTGKTAAAEENNSEIIEQSEVTTLEELRKVPAEQIAAWPKYDSRDYDIVTKVESQIPYNLCWVYSSVAAAETSILREGCDPTVTKDFLNLDEIEIAKAVRGKFLDPLGIANGENLSPSQTEWDQSGVIEFVSRLASHWQGFYNTDSAPDLAEAGYSQYILDGFEMCQNDVAQIKSLLSRYGAAAFEYCAMLSDTEYYLAKGLQTHASTIVGWDDTISKELFQDARGNTIAKRDGAWIVKNSWGTEYHRNGYFWLSYDSELVNITAFDFSTRDEEKYLYNYAGNSTGTMNWTAYPAQFNTKFAYVFTPRIGEGCTETIESVSVGFAGTDPKITVEIYPDLTVNGTHYTGSKTPAAVTSYEAHCTKGLYTIPLNNPVEIKDGKPFCVVVSLSAFDSILMDFNSNTNHTPCYIYNGSSWSRMRIGDGQLPAIHPIVRTDLSQKREIYGETLFNKIEALNETINSMSGKEFSAENYFVLSELNRHLSAFSQAERNQLWLMDEMKLAKYEEMIDRWSKLVKGAQTPFELSKKLL